MGGDTVEKSNNINYPRIKGIVQETIAQRDNLDPEDIVFLHTVIFQTPNNTYGFLQDPVDKEIFGITLPNDIDPYLSSEQIQVASGSRILRVFLQEEGSIPKEFIPFIEIDSFLEVPDKKSKHSEILILLKDNLNDNFINITEDGVLQGEYIANKTPDYTEEIPDTEN